MRSRTLCIHEGSLYFPGQELPRAYLVDTSEEALLIPDWLKLKMIRSSVSVLVDSALRYNHHTFLIINADLAYFQ
jgi:hypothetical protein